MKSLNGVAVAAAWSAMAAGGLVHAQEPIFVVVPLSELANVSLEDPPQTGYSAPLEALDPLMLNGVPFVHPSGPWAWNSHVAAVAGEPTSIALAVGGLRAEAIHTQLNTYWGTAAGTSGLLEIHFADGSSVSNELIGGYNVRDYNGTGSYTNTLTAPNATIGLGWATGRMDVQRWSLTDFTDRDVAAVSVHDFGSSGTSRLVLGGVTLEFTADCNGDGIVDYGQVLEGTFEDANANGVPDCCEDGTDCQCVGDVNNDGQVNGADISVLLGFWGLNGKPVAADINKDGTVDGADLAQLLGSWGECK